jgi:hypothetical protein
VVDERLPRLAAVAGVAVAVGALLLASAAGGPYLTADGVNGWIVVFAAGTFAALFATPFVIERRLRPAIADSDKRWERALLYWGAISVVALGAGILVGASTEWASGDSLAGAAGLLLSIEAVLVLGAMAVWLLSG